ncbi:MAG: hypothetical protein HY556_02090 [Euryarchaeota archaeon]|nr:hypothetical protein [Euryarchaeota archaeon]
MVPDINLLEWEGGHGHRFTHDLFRFPGKFHPPLVEHVLRSADPKAVIDPMAGVGTVAVEAKAAGIPSLSIDIDPVSVFFARVKTTPISEETLAAAWKDLSDALQRFRRNQDEIEIRKFRDIRHDVMRKSLAQVKARDLERLTYWFRRYALVDYARIDHSIFNGGLPQRGSDVRRFFWACLLSSIRRISLADPQPVSGLEITKHMKEKIREGYEIDVFSEFERRATLGLQRMGEFTQYLQENKTRLTPSTISQSDSAGLGTSKRAAKLEADLILFSPPYCNAIEYWRRHRLEYFVGRFLDEEQVVVLKRKFVGRTIVGETVQVPPALGFRPLDGLIEGLIDEQRSHKARVLWQYFNDMSSRLKIFFDYLPSGGHCVIIVGNSTTGGRTVPTAKTLTWLGEEVGFEHVKTARYDIKNRVMQYPTKHNAKIEKESIIVLQKS